MNLITIIKQYLNLIIFIFIVLLTFYFSSLYYNNKIDKINNNFSNYKNINEKNIQAQKLSIVTQTNKFNEENLILTNKLKDLENEKYKTFTELQKANAIIKSNINNSTNSLYINAKCTTNTKGKTEDNTTGSMVNGDNSKAIIDRRDAEAIIEITNKGDKYKSQLEGLQEWVKILVDNNNK